MGSLLGPADPSLQGRKHIRLFPPWAAVHLQPIGGWFGSPGDENFPMVNRGHSISHVAWMSQEVSKRLLKGL